MVGEYYYPNSGVRVEKPYTFTRVKIDTINGSIPTMNVPVYVYIGDGEKVEYFDKYCIEQLRHTGHNIEDFMTIDASIGQMVLLICLPNEFMKFDNFICDVQRKALNYYKNLIYFIVEFDSLMDLGKCIHVLPKKKRELKYDYKTKKYYLKVRDDDGLSPMDFGKVSMVPNIRFDVLQDVSEIAEVI